MPVADGGDQHKPDQSQAGKNTGPSSEVSQLGPSAVGLDPAMQFHQKAEEIKDFQLVRNEHVPQESLARS